MLLRVRDELVCRYGCKNSQSDGWGSQSSRIPGARAMGGNAVRSVVIVGMVGSGAITSAVTR
eukprot:SAG31_NODE_23529_length_500_cov_0.940447_2_plen_61_part_01